MTAAIDASASSSLAIHSPRRTAGARTSAIGTTRGHVADAAHPVATTANTRTPAATSSFMGPLLLFHLDRASCTLRRGAGDWGGRRGREEGEAGERGSRAHGGYFTQSPQRAESSARPR